MQRVALTSRETSSVSPREEEAEGDHISEYKYLEEGCKEDRARLFTMVPSARTRDNWHQVKNS